MEQRPNARITIIAGAVAAAVALVVGSGSAVLANHVFPDSTDGQAFHTQVGNVAGAGCATGFPDGTFDPQGNVNRQQFAAWMNRCAGRVARIDGGNTTLTTSGSGAKQTIGTMTIEAGATGDIATGGFLVISGNIRAESTNPANCPCFVQAEVAEELGAVGAADDTEIGQQRFTAIPQGATDVSGRNYATLPFDIVTTIAPDQALTINVNAFFVDANVTGGILMNPNFTAVYVPFGPDGDNTVDFESE